MNINPNQHITEFLNYYCSLPTAPQYAIMLKGKWGSGKTHFINEYKNVLKENNKKYIYVSLYGVTSYDEIETKFLEVLHPKLYNKKTILAGKIAKGLLKTTLKIDLDDDGKSDGTIRSEAPNLNTGDLLNTKDYILIFDDLERCSIDINDLLGYINYFVEHQEYKVILLANDEKFKSEEYKDIKEKLIGKTFEVISNTELAYDSFIKEIKENNLFIDYKDTIIKIYIQSGYNNLRVFRQVILDFDRFNQSINLNNFKKELVKNFVTEYFIFAIENRFQSYTISKFEKSNKDDKSSLEAYINGNDTVPDKENIYSQFIKKYNSFLFEPYILSFKTWSDILNSSIIEKKNIMETFHKSKYSFDKNTLSWIKLQNFTSIKDEGFKILLSDVELNIKKNNYTNLDDILNISTLLLELQENKLYAIEKEELLNLIYQNIDYIFEQNHLTEDDFSFEKTLSRKNNYDKDVYTYYQKKENVFHKETMQSDAIQILKYLKEKDNRKVYTLLSFSNTERNYKDKEILSIINIQQLIDILVLNETNSAYFFGNILNDRYTNYIYNNNLIHEMSFLKELEQEIEKEYKKRIGEVSGYNLKTYFLKSSLPKAINDLQADIRNKEKNEIHKKTN